MSDLDSLRAAILRDPKDNIVRLAYADALDERAQPGDALYAEFIRLQVWDENFSRAAELLAMQELRLAAFHDNQLGPLVEWKIPVFGLGDSHEYYDGVWSVTGTVKWNTIGFCWMPHPTAVIKGHITRGFISAIECAPTVWEQHSDRLTAYQPITEVTIVGRSDNYDSPYEKVYPGIRFVFTHVP